MEDPRQPHTPSSSTDDDGVRVIRRVPHGGRWLGNVPTLASALALGLAVGAGYLFYVQQAVPTASTDRAQEAVQGAGTDPTSPAPRPIAALTSRRQPARVLEQEPEHDFELPSQDPDDLAAHFSFDDPEPTMAEVIAALNDAGIHSGMGAFNPPGTSPPLPGLAVPDDFELPEGFVRHHQVTDDGESIEPILMFSPDFEFFDEAGNRIELPPDLVVPPELAPPGLPISQIEIPSP
jgi:hypothetical protein